MKRARVHRGDLPVRQPAWPFIARAQQPELPVVAFIHSGTAMPGPLCRCIPQRAKRSGLYRRPECHGRVPLAGGALRERLAALLADLIRRRVAAIATPGGIDAARAVKVATTTIPLVFSVGEDPALGIVPSLRGRAATRLASIFSRLRSTPNGSGSCMSSCPG